jgi:hypothetical protein
VWIGVGAAGHRKPVKLSPARQEMVVMGSGEAVRERKMEWRAQLCLFICAAGQVGSALIHRSG